MRIALPGLPDSWHPTCSRLLRRLAAGSGALVVATPWLVKYAIDTGLDIDLEAGTVDGNTGTLATVSALLIAAAVLRGVFVYFQTTLAERVSQAVAYDLRNRMYDHLQRLSYAYHDQAEIGQIMSRATQDVEGVRFFVSMGIIRLLYVVAQPGALMFTGDAGLRLVASLLVIGTIAGLTVETIFRKLLGVDVLQTRSIAVGGAARDGTPPRGGP